MPNQLTPDEYFRLVKNIYQLIIDDFENSQKQDSLQFLYQTYPKLVIMYEFFRLLRGEAFVDIRPQTPEKQKEYYQWEDELKIKVKEISRKLNPNDPATRFSLEQAKKAFDL